MELVSSIKRFYNYVRWLYMQYLLNTALYMLEPSEVRIFNLFVLVVFATCVYSTYVFLPSQMSRIFSWLSAAATASSSASPILDDIPLTNTASADL